MNARDLMSLDHRGRKLALIGELTGPEIVGWRQEAAFEKRTLDGWEDDALTRRERELRGKSK